MGATLNFIDIWLKFFEDNYDARCVVYSTSMKDMFNQMPLTMIKARTPKQQVQKLIQKLLVDSIWKSAKGLPTLKISTLSKKS